ncbi:MAG: family 43 glycosylhydrolase [Bacteroidales bacterium]
MKVNKNIIYVWMILLLSIWKLQAQNPIIRDQFTADPTARVFGDKVYLYPSHDILAKEGQGRPGWFCMEDYHVFSSQNLTEWTDHGVIVSQDKVPWTAPDAFSMWAPDCIFRNNKYYFYFPAPAKDTIYGKGFSVGVAVADKPEGPFIPESKPVTGVHGIDPNVFIDKDGQAYLYWAARNIYVAKLKENMLELASEPEVIENLPEKGLKEGPYLFERKGIYYLTYPHVENKIERLEYAIGNSPLGPFTQAGVIMDESPMNCWTNHQSIIEYKGQWYLFYHQNAFSPKFDKNRAVCIDSLFFENDCSIRKVIPSFRGVGLNNASEPIQIDRYSLKSENGISIEFMDTLNTFLGWKTVFSARNSWIQYNAIDFGNEKLKKVRVKALSKTGGTLQIRFDKADGKILAEIKIPECTEWKTFETKVPKFPTGIRNLVFVHKESKMVEIDWVQFVK